MYHLASRDNIYRKSGCVTKLMFYSAKHETVLSTLKLIPFDYVNYQSTEVAKGDAVSLLYCHYYISKFSSNQFVVCKWQK